jgi:hypothetical protein
MRRPQGRAIYVFLPHRVHAAFIRSGDTAFATE